MGGTCVGTSVGGRSVGCTGVSGTGVNVACGVTGVDAADVEFEPELDVPCPPAPVDGKAYGVLEGVDVVVGLTVAVGVCVRVGVIEGVRVIVGVPVKPGLSSIYQRSAMAVLVLLTFFNCSGLKGSDKVRKPTI